MRTIFRCSHGFKAAYDIGHVQDSDGLVIVGGQITLVVVPKRYKIAAIGRFVYDHVEDDGTVVYVQESEASGPTYHHNHDERCYVNEYGARGEGGVVSEPLCDCGKCKEVIDTLNATARVIARRLPQCGKLTGV